jgi:multidrug transporter EmrE-like cation transporter
VNDYTQYAGKPKFVWAGLLGLGATFIIWVIALSNIKLSIAYPVYIGIEYCLVILLSWLIIGDTFTIIKIGGIFLVLFGIVLINI